MPTILTHPVIPLAITMATGREVISRRLLLAGIIASMLPDLDVLGFRLGIPYATEFGHRGFTHSLFVACLFAVVGASLATYLKATATRTFSFLFVAMASHAVLDACTNGGMGIALLWPFSDVRLFAPFRPIQVSPIGLHHLLSPRGLSVLQSELLWVWLPAFCLGACGFVIRRWLMLYVKSGKSILNTQTDEIS